MDEKQTPGPYPPVQEYPYPAQPGVGPGGAFPSTPLGTPLQQQPMMSPGYGPTPQMTTSSSNGGNRNALNKPFKADGKRDWSFGILDFVSGACGTCVFSWICPCLQFGKNTSRTRHLMAHGSAHPQGGDMFNAQCCTYAALLYCGCPCLVHMSHRSDVRTRYNVEGGSGSDFLCTWCCIPCALTQESRELSLEEESLIGQQKI